MIAASLAWFVKGGIPAWAAKRGAALLLALIVGGGIKLWFAQHDRAVIELNDAAAKVELEVSARRADQNMQARIDARGVAAAAIRREFDNASIGIPHEGLTRRQRLDLCIELRDAGADTAVLPECCDLHAGGAACALAGHPAER
ncbi:MAG: hypothetical protein ABL874_09035 [Sphingopyxis sp.]